MRKNYHFHKKMIKIKNLEKEKKKLDDASIKDSIKSKQYQNQEKSEILNYWRNKFYPCYMKLIYSDGSGHYYEIDGYKHKIHDSYNPVELIGQKISSYKDKIDFDISRDYIISSFHSLETISQSEYESIKKDLYSKAYEKSNKKPMPEEIDIEKLNDYEKQYLIKYQDEWESQNKYYYNKCYKLFETNEEYIEDTQDFENVTKFVGYAFVYDIGYQNLFPCLFIKFGKDNQFLGFSIDSKHLGEYHKEEIDYDFFKNHVNLYIK